MLLLLALTFIAEFICWWRE